MQWWPGTPVESDARLEASIDPALVQGWVFKSGRGSKGFDLYRVP